jgi:hypothetical protein
MQYPAFATDFIAALLIEILKLVCIAQCNHLFCEIRAIASIWIYDNDFNVIA